MKTKGLFSQIIKFLLVGGACFVVDFLLYSLLANIIGVHYLVAGACSFAVSVLMNYFLSMRFVFRHRDDISRKREFIVFVILSIIGCGLNELILFLCIDVSYEHIEALQSLMSPAVANMAAKIIAAGIVMIYNFISRKIYLERD